MKVKKQILILLCILVICVGFIMPVYAQTNIETDLIQNNKLSLPVLLLTDLQVTENRSILQVFLMPTSEQLQLGEQIYFGTDNIYNTKGGIKYGFQVDYKLDDSDWKYNSNWDSLNANNPESMFKNQLPIDISVPGKEMYQKTVIDTYNGTQNDDITALLDGHKLIIDGHNLELRCRAYLQYTNTNDEMKLFFSDWTEPVKVDTEKNTLYPDTKLKISETHVKNLDKQAIISVAIEQNPDLYKIKAMYIAEHGSPDDLELEAILVPTSSDGTFIINDNAIPLSYLNTSKEGKINIQFRCDNQGIKDYDNYGLALRMHSKDNTVKTSYSDVYSLAILTGENPAEDADGNKLEAEAEILDVCPICGFCSQPGGHCIFFYITIAIAILIVGITVAYIVYRKKRNE